MVANSFNPLFFCYANTYRIPVLQWAYVGVVFKIATEMKFITKPQLMGNGLHRPGG